MRASTCIASSLSFSSHLELSEGSARLQTRETREAAREEKRYTSPIARKNELCVADA